MRYIKDMTDVECGVAVTPIGPMGLWKCCQKCKFSDGWEKTATLPIHQNFVLYTVGVCWRFPKWATVMPMHFCAEFKPLEDPHGPEPSHP